MGRRWQHRFGGWCGRTAPSGLAGRICFGLRNNLAIGARKPYVLFDGLRVCLGRFSPRCIGIGSIRSIESLALSILRLIGEETRKDRTARLIVQVPVDGALADAKL